MELYNHELDLLLHIVRRGVGVNSDMLARLQEERYSHARGIEIDNMANIADAISKHFEY